MDNIPDWKNAIMVSPDAGGAKRFEYILLKCFSFHKYPLSLKLIVHNKIFERNI